MQRILDRSAGHPAKTLSLLAILALAVLPPLAGPTPAVAAQDGRSILDDPARPDAERARDAGTRPLELYAWFGVEPGMTVVDVLPGGGYNTHVLSGLVGAEGEVIAAYPFGDQGRQNLQSRFGDVDNVRIVDDLSGVADGSVDMVVTVRNLHDMLIPSIADRFGVPADAVIPEMYRVLRPGGTLAVVDARTDMEGVDADTHRIDQETAVETLESHGFELVDSSDLLAVPDDDHSQPGFPERWEIDRFVLKLRKPAM